jgi:hypothetical protein
MTVTLFKQRFSFFVLGVTIGWAVFSVIITKNALEQPTPSSVLEASGVNVLLGAMINWCGNVIQNWFRKSKPLEEDEEEPK